MENKETHLVLELPQGRMLMIEGVRIVFRNKARIEIQDPANFLFGKQIMKREDANTLGREIHFALQGAYIPTSKDPGPKQEERDKNLAEALRLLSLFAEKYPLARDKVALASEHAKNGEYYQAIKITRSLTRYEDNLLASSGNDAAPHAPVHPAKNGASSSPLIPT